MATQEDDLSKRIRFHDEAIGLPLGAEKCNAALGKRIANSLRNGKLVSDITYGLILSSRGKRFSRRHWTPVGLAYRAAMLLTDHKACDILDVGSGLGKFCLIGALTTPGRFFGVERRKWLVAEARETALLLGIERVEFGHGDMADLDWSRFDGVYLYNPFCENILESIRIDLTVPLGKRQYDEFVSVVEKKLETLRIGARVVTLHGFGGRMPVAFTRTLCEPWGDGFLELWEKQSA